MQRSVDRFVEPEDAADEEDDQRREQGPEEALPPVPERMGLIRGRTLLNTPMSKNTWTATSAALAAVWARRATAPVTAAATASPSVSAQFTTRETTTLRRVVPRLAGARRAITAAEVPSRRSGPPARSARFA